MKKIVSLLLTAIMCLSLVACSGGKEVKMSKDEMLAIAEEYTAGDIQGDSIDNIAKAKIKYCNKTIILSGTVRNIHEDYIVLSSSYAANYQIDVYLPLEELVLLKRDQYITVVGTTTDEIIDVSETSAQYTFNYSHYQMPIAYLVKDTSK